MLGLAGQELRELREEINALTVRRTRRYITTTSPAVGGRATFPHIEQQPVRYRLTPQMRSLFIDVLDAAADPDVMCAPELVEEMERLRGAGPRFAPLTLAAYVPQCYDLHEPEPPTWVAPLLPLIRSLLLKRIESSPAAFAETARHMADRTRQALADLAEGVVRITVSAKRRRQLRELVRQWLASSPDEAQEETAEQEELRDFLSSLLGGTVIPGSLGGLPKECLRRADDFDVPALREALEHDLTVLDHLATEADAARHEDPKATAFLCLMDTLEAKTLVFSEARDTTTDLGRRIRDHLTRHPQHPLQDRFANLGSKERPREEETNRVLAGFCPETAADLPLRIGDVRTKDRYDLLLTTDMLSEGVNLQQARAVVNYDLPWNPMRITQRLGRVDRIGSPHDMVHCYTFLPDEVLDVWLGLIDRLRAKTATAARLVGVSTALFPDAPVETIDYATLVERLEKPHVPAYTAPPLDELQRMWLHRAQAVPTLRHRIEHLTRWAGAVHPDPADAPSVVYCFHVIRSPGAARVPAFCRVYGGARQGATSLDPDRCLREIDLDPTDWIEGRDDTPVPVTSEQRHLVLTLLGRARKEVAAAFGIPESEAERHVRLIAWMLRPSTLTPARSA
ncbi:C-terminal helicase domain-containing protein [Streptomyces sp. cg2]|uniref:C-terminal helicase domain-containing protein n=1 Tax=Streptomyces sp. cg2 TaxID=3238799 RepID=UPI0034E27CA4